MTASPAQAAIMVLGVAAIRLISGEGRAKQIGFALGLASQPFWLYETWTAAQPAMFALSCFYIWAWGEGLLKSLKKGAADETL